MTIEEAMNKYDRVDERIEQENKRGERSNRRFVATLTVDFDEQMYLDLCGESSDIKKMTKQFASMMLSNMSDCDEQIQIYEHGIGFIDIPSADIPPNKIERRNDLGDFHDSPDRKFSDY